MAYLAAVGSFSVNGVAELHSRLLCESLLRDFADLWPEKFNNKTNGVTPSSLSERSIINPFDDTLLV
jgi:starch phosphorylase